MDVLLTVTMLAAACTLLVALIARYLQAASSAYPGLTNAPRFTSSAATMVAGAKAPLRPVHREPVEATKNECRSQGSSHGDYSRSRQRPCPALIDRILETAAFEGPEFLSDVQLRLIRENETFRNELKPAARKFLAVRPFNPQDRDRIDGIFADLFDL